MQSGRCGPTREFRSATTGDESTNSQTLLNSKAQFVSHAIFDSSVGLAMCNSLCFNLTTKSLQL